MTKTSRALKILGVTGVAGGPVLFAVGQGPFTGRLCQAIATAGMGTVFYAIGTRSPPPRWLLLPAFLFSALDLASTRWPVAGFFLGPPLIVFGAVFFAVGRAIEEGRNARAAFAVVSGACVAAGIFTLVLYWPS